MFNVKERRLEICLYFKVSYSSAILMRIEETHGTEPPMLNLRYITEKQMLYCKVSQNFRVAGEQNYCGNS